MLGKTVQILAPMHHTSIEEYAVSFNFREKFTVVSHTQHTTDTERPPGPSTWRGCTHRREAEAVLGKLEDHLNGKQA